MPNISEVELTDEEHGVGLSVEIRKVKPFNDVRINHGARKPPGII